MKLKLNDFFFLLAGVIFVVLGYSSIHQIVNGSTVSVDSNEWWGIGLTLFGGLLLGKWLSDNWKMKKK